jgi:predicted dehydrogenase
MRIGLVGIESDHAEDALRLFNREQRWPGYEVVALWGAAVDAARAQRLATGYGVGWIAPEPEAMTGRIDAVIVGARHAGLHAAHALPYLERGIPAFVDKPLALSVADAQTMLDAAEASRALLLSGSALRWQADAVALKAQATTLGRLTKVMATGTFYPDSEYGGPAFYAVHAVELALEFAGQGIADITVVEASDETMTITGRGRLADVEIRLVRPAEGQSSRFAVDLEGQGGKASREIALPDDYMAPVYAQFVGMIERGTAPLTRRELLAPVRVLEVVNGALATHTV